MSILDIIKFFIAISVLPSIILMWVVYKEDKIEKEPLGLLTALFFIGGISIIPAAFIESYLGGIGSSLISGTSNFTLFIKAFIGIALVEEGIKFMILKIGTWKNKNFNYTFDAIVYATFVSLGFATFENILYVLSSGVFTAILRAITSIPGHMTFGVLMGIYYGRAKVCENNRNIAGKNGNLAFCLTIPVLLHGLFDFCLFTKNGWFLLIFLALIISIYVISFRSINKYSRSDSKINKSIESFEDAPSEEKIGSFTDDFSDIKFNNNNNEF